MCLHKPLTITKEAREQEYWYKVYDMIADGKYKPMYYSVYFSCGQSSPYKMGDKLYRHLTVFDDEVKKRKTIAYGSWSLIQEGKRYPYGFHCYRYLEDAEQEMRMNHGSSLAIVKVKVGTIVAYGTELGFTKAGVFKTIQLVEDVTQHEE